ncbi:hypothetical protein [Rhodovulum steppense]|uniref:Lipoprotein n=1 Tax=Rhodovulum steppense TaxID=540251 RepID=A0A4R1YUQ4_9RHOB|nr:hypothetical protein [Rhodovulum steppense]TCM84821.1 hypothetical protein EV216_110139 [Rhodovulum steppense]
MRWIVLACACTALSGCAAGKPVVAAYNGDSVSIQQFAYWAQAAPSEETAAEAARICAKGSKKRAEYASSRQLPGYITEHLYLCL